MSSIKLNSKFNSNHECSNRPQSNSNYAEFAVIREVCSQIELIWNYNFHSIANNQKFNKLINTIGALNRIWSISAKHQLCFVQCCSEFGLQNEIWSHIMELNFRQRREDESWAV